ncbi:hypothetical protein [Pandoravirus japonicus]|uniref:Uncharacterized protein n=1 Tax=Pandoravirus japonicus TaxID=2823154 RepID=A0A811BTK4_9VIRU|nr:hypothetical protein [Pandoravirus japonicus]
MYPNRGVYNGDVKWVVGVASSVRAHKGLRFSLWTAGFIHPPGHADPTCPLSPCFCPFFSRERRSRLRVPTHSLPAPTPPLTCRPLKAKKDDSRRPPHSFQAPWHQKRPNGHLAVSRFGAGAQTSAGCGSGDERHGRETWAMPRAHARRAWIFSFRQRLADSFFVGSWRRETARFGKPEAHQKCRSTKQRRAGVQKKEDKQAVSTTTKKCIVAKTERSKALVG